MQCMGGNAKTAYRRKFIVNVWGQCMYGTMYGWHHRRQCVVHAECSRQRIEDNV